MNYIIKGAASPIRSVSKEVVSATFFAYKNDTQKRLSRNRFWSQIKGQNSAIFGPPKSRFGERSYSGASTEVRRRFCGEILSEFSLSLSNLFVSPKTRKNTEENLVLFNEFSPNTNAQSSLPNIIFCKKSFCQKKVLSLPKEKDESIRKNILPII